MSISAVPSPGTRTGVRELWWQLRMDEATWRSRLSGAGLSESPLLVTSVYSGLPAQGWGFSDNTSTVGWSVYWPCLCVTWQTTVTTLYNIRWHAGHLTLRRHATICQQTRDIYVGTHIPTYATLELRDTGQMLLRLLSVPGGRGGTGPWGREGHSGRSGSGSSVGLPSEGL